MAGVVKIIYSPFKDIWLYIKHKHRHVKDLDDNFITLNLRYEGLLATKKHIDRELKFKTKNEKYDILEGQINDIKRKYLKLKSKFEKWRSHSGGEPSTPMVATNENVANGGEGSSTSSTQVAQNHQGARKIVTWKFSSNGRLDKDVLKLIREIDALKIHEIKPETLVNEEITVQRKNAPERDRMPLWKYVKKLSEYLENERYKRIGIYGEPQVGKSTVLKQLNNCAHPRFSSSSSSSSSSSISLKYDVVIWVNFPSKDSGDVKEKIQQEILKSIRVSDEKSLQHNATKIDKVLAKEKYLLILDGVYEGIDLTELGIYNNHKHGKIVIGATGLSVLSRMNVDESISIKKLEYDVAERFFKESLCCKSSDNDLSSVQPYIKKIIELLDGHIGGLVGIADYMKSLGSNNTDLNVWEAIVYELQSPNSPQNLELGALEKAYKLPYEGLQDKNIRKCLLYVALFPVGYYANTSYLVECWKAEGFLQGCRTFKEARIRGTVVFLKLKETHLLEWFDEELLKMPLLFRKVALQIPYPDDKEGDNKLLVRNISERCSHPSEQEWAVAKRISLMCGKLDSEFLPDSPMCNDTLTLLLQTNFELKVIGSQFFANMGKLLVLDLQRTTIKVLPKSISELENLKCLYLNDCSSLKSLPTEMKELKQLELLDIRRTMMKNIPGEIRYLKPVRCLRISLYSLAGNQKEIVMHSQPSCFSSEFENLKFLEELTVHIDPQTPERGSIVDQIKEALKEDHKYVQVKWEPEESSYLHNSNNVIANGSQSNGQYTTIPHSSTPMTKPTTGNKLEHVNQTHEASTSATNNQHTESTKDWVQKRFKHS